MEHQNDRDQLMADLKGLAYAELQEEHARLAAEVANLRISHKTFLQQAQKIHHSIPAGLMTAEYTEAYEALHHSQGGYTNSAPSYAINDAQTTQIDTTKLAEVVNTLREARRYFLPSLLDAPTNNQPQEQLYAALTDLQNNFHSHSSMVVSYMAQRHDLLSQNAREQIKEMLRPYFYEAADLRQLTSRIVTIFASNLQLESGELDMLNSELRQPIAATLEGLSNLILEAIGAEKIEKTRDEIVGRDQWNTAAHGLEDPII